MGFRIATNISSIAAQRTLAQTNKSQMKALGDLSSGTRIQKAGDDAAGLAISEKLKGQVRSINQATRNANDGISLIQTAEGGMNEISNILVRLRELSMQSASDTVGDPERKFTNLEYQNLKQEIERISQVTEFNGKKLLNGAGDKYEFQIGMNNDATQDRINYNAQASNATLESLGIGELTVASKQESQESLAKLDMALQNLSGQRAELGAVQNRLSSTINNLEVAGENLSAANSGIRDTDMAKAAAENTKLGILNQAGTAVLSQANAQGQAALKLIG